MPTVPDDNRLSVSELGSGVRQVIARVGFTENPTTGTHCSRPEWSSETSRRAQPQTPAFGSGLPNTGRVRCPMQPHPIPRGLRDQLNPDNNNLALKPGGLTIRDTPSDQTPRLLIEKIRLRTTAVFPTDLDRPTCTPVT